MHSISTADPVDQAAFRKLMGLFATGVCVVSFRTNDTAGSAVSGMTINSLVSVSLDPMLVCWSLQNSASQFGQYLEADEFAFSILADGQQAIARRYAARGNAGLSNADFAETSRGLPVVKDALATIECRKWAAHPAGDHTLILGEVMAIATGVADEDPRALGFFGGRFCAIE